VCQDLFDHEAAKIGRDELSQARSGRSPMPADGRHKKLSMTRTSMMPIDEIH
jgi:hypothetical protein